MSSCARHGDWPPVREAQGASPYFGIRHQNVSFCRTIRPIRIKFGIEHQGNKALSCYAPLLDPPFQSGWGTMLTPKSSIIFKNLFVRNYGFEYIEINMGASGACLDGKLGSARRLAPR